MKGDRLEEFEEAITDDTDLVVLESPSSIMMTLQDIQDAAPETVPQPGPSFHAAADAPPACGFPGCPARLPSVLKYRRNLMQRQQRGNCGLMSFELDGSVEQAKAFCQALTDTPSPLPAVQNTMSYPTRIARKKTAACPYKAANACSRSAIRFSESARRRRS